MALIRSGQGSHLLGEGCIDRQDAAAKRRIPAPLAADRGLEVTVKRRECFTPAVDLRYGITNRFEVEAKVPYVWRKDSTLGREIVATSVRNGGFPPLLLDPVDFVALYQQRAAQTQAAQPTPTSS